MPEPRTPPGDAAPIIADEVAATPINPDEADEITPSEASTRDLRLAACDIDDEVVDVGSGGSDDDRLRELLHDSDDDDGGSANPEGEECDAT